MGLDLHPGRKRQGEDGWDYDAIANAPCEECYGKLQ